MVIIAMALSCLTQSDKPTPPAKSFPDLEPTPRILFIQFIILGLFINNAPIPTIYRCFNNPILQVTTTPAL
jgi:hypothetical protein